MFRHLIPMLLLLAAAFPIAGRAQAGVIATFDLGPATVSPTSASFDVSLTFTGDPGDTIEAIQLSVLGSDPTLTAGDTDFSRFTFAINGTTLPGWVEFISLSVLGVGSYGPDFPFTGPFLSPDPSPYHLGTLTVDLSGLPGGVSFLVTIAGGPPGLNTDVGGTVDGNLETSFHSAGAAVATVSFDDPSGVNFTSQGSAVVPGPPGSLLAMIGMGGLCAYVRRWQLRKAGARMHSGTWVAGPPLENVRS